MKRLTLAAVLLFAAPAAHAQRSVATELGIFGQYSIFSDTTHLKNGLGAGIRLGMYPLRNIALEYEADRTTTSSTRVGNLVAWNNRVDLIFYFPMSQQLKLLVGGGWTGTQYHTDTTKNQFDSGGNAVAGFKICFNEDWAMRTDANVDFKDPSDQTPDGARTQTYNIRVGFSRFLGGTARNSPCYVAAEKMTTTVAYVPPPAPAPTPAPAPAPAPEPVVVAPPAPTPPVAPAPPPVRRELLTLRGNVFEFDKSNLTAGARDTLQRAVTLLKENPNANVEIIGHTDSKGSDEYNQKLSERRANSVRDFLVLQGIAASRITTIGKGESEPAESNATAKGRAINRRVVIIEIR
jgi:OOP family OmpA-OmpF porin